MELYTQEQLQIAYDMGLLDGKLNNINYSITDDFIPIEIISNEEDIKDAYEQGVRLALISQSDLALHKGKFPTPDEWFEQFKNK